MLIVGIDPGSRVTGYGVIRCDGNRLSVQDYGIITTDPDQPMPARLEKIHQGLRDILARNRPDEAAIEEIFYSNNAKSALVLGQARGVALLALQQQGIPVAEYAARQIKRGTAGFGAASKDQVQYMIKKMFPTVKDTIPADAADALAVALCHVHAVQFKKRFAAQVTV
jgi:crossover junction endodeoxyribonuclease RuvC